MSLETFDIEEFTGVDRNVISPSTAPIELFNLLPDRRGGYRPFGSMATDTTTGTILAQILGFDETGFLVSRQFNTPNWDVRFTIVGQTAINGIVDTANILASPAAFIPGMGMLGSPSRFLTRLADNLNTIQLRPPGALAEPTSTLGTETSPTIFFRFAAFPYLSTPAGALHYIPASRTSMYHADGSVFHIATNSSPLTLTFTLPDPHVNIDLYVGPNTPGGAPLTFLKTIRHNDLTAIIREQPVGLIIRPLDLVLASFDTIPQPVMHNGRVWGLFRNTADSWQNRRASFDEPNIISRDFAIPNTLIYSERGSVNLFSRRNYENLALQSSRFVNALASTADNAYGELGGLLVFADNETFVVHSDPALPDFRITRFPSPIGCDRGTLPATMGSTVFVIWKGKLFAVAGGEAIHISGQVDTTDAFTQVVVDDRTQSVFVRTAANVFLQYHPLYKAWTNPPVTGSFTMIPAPDPRGIRFQTPNAYGQLRFIDQSAHVAPVIRYPTLFYGDRYTRKAHRMISLSTSGAGIAARLDYSTNTGTTDSRTAVTNRDGRLLFRLPFGVVSEGIAPSLFFPATSTPAAVGAGGSLAHVGGDFIFALRGGGTTDFWRYSISANSWTAMAAALAAVGAGGALTHTGGDFIFALRGGTTTTFTFWRYSISANTWTVMYAAPAAVGAGGALTHTGGDFIYALQGNATNAFWRYSISANTWSAMAAAPAAVNWGGALAHTGGDFIYAFQGGTTNFWRYSISTNTWTAMTAIPVAVSGGGALVHTGGDFIYALRGSAVTDFLRYSISANTWVAMAPAPSGVREGGALVHTGGDFIYALRGGGDGAFWRYSISANSWTTLPIDMLLHPPLRFEYVTRNKPRR